MERGEKKKKNKTATKTQETQPKSPLRGSWERSDGKKKPTKKKEENWVKEMVDKERKRMERDSPPFLDFGVFLSPAGSGGVGRERGTGGV